MPKVILDASQVYHRYEHGYKYFREMLPRLAGATDFSIEVIASPMGLVEVPAAAPGVVVRDRFGLLKKVIPRGRLRRCLGAFRTPVERMLWRIPEVRSEARREKALFHSLFYTLAPNDKLALIATALDLIPEKLGGQHGVPRDEAALTRRAKCIQAAHRIIAISHRTKADLVEYFGLPADKVDVVHLGVNGAFFGAPLSQEAITCYRERHNIEAPYLLQVGGRMNHKNFFRLLEAFSQSSLKRDYLLVAAGEPWNEEEKAALQRHNVADRVRNIVLPEEEELRTLYRAASVFVYPSLYEGFGLPPIEAMAAGAPVAAARAGSIPEVCGEAARYFDPKDTSAIASTIEDLCDKARADEFRARGLRQASTFTWDKTAERTAAVYRTAFASLEGIS